MPFTPFHFGPGALAKAAAPWHFSFAAFVATQVVIDVETLYYLERRQWPVHRELHTLAGGTLAAIAVAAALLAVRPALLWLARHRLGPEILRAGAVVAETSATGVVVGSLVGAWSHSLLDALMHLDVQPFWPLRAGNPLLGLVSDGWLHVGCAVSGLLGALLLWAADRAAGLPPLPGRRGD